MRSDLSPPQLAAGTLIYKRAIAHGVPPHRAAELVDAAFSESGLNAHAVNKSSGAAGFFQLLSPGYVQKANQHGGVFNPVANTDAILPDYATYWRQHPNAAPGEAARDVERSGEGAGFYTNPAGEQVAARAGGTRSVAAAPAVGAGSAATGAPPQAMPMIDPAARSMFAKALIANLDHNHDPHANVAAVAQAVQQLRASAPTPPAPSDGAVTPDGGPELHPHAIVKGAMAFPVAGPVNFTDTWGAYRADTGHHEGVDIFAKRGTPVVAIRGGTITKMGPSEIGGNRVWINGQWYYAHLDGFAPGIEPGVKVHRGQVLGYVGDTGDAKGTPTHLHFGWSPDSSQGSSWANPYPVLKSLYGG